MRDEHQLEKESIPWEGKRRRINKLPRGVVGIRDKAVKLVEGEEVVGMLKNNPWEVVERMEEIDQQNPDCVECKDWRCKVHGQRANNGWIKSPNQLEDEMEKGEGEYMWRLRHW